MIFLSQGSPASDWRHAADVGRLEFRLSQDPGDELDFYFLECWLKLSITRLSVLGLVGI